MKNGYKEAWMAGQNRQRWEFPFVESELGGNIYCLNVVMQSREDPDIQVTLSAPVSPPVSYTHLDVYKRQHRTSVR